MAKKDKRGDFPWAKAVDVCMRIAAAAIILGLVTFLLSECFRCP